MTDWYIAMIAANEREAAQQFLDWHLDNLRLHAGILEPVPDDEPDVPIRRRLRRRNGGWEGTRSTSSGPVFERAIYCARRTDGCPKYGHFHLVRPTRKDQP
jgi:hypothetical protein